VNSLLVVLLISSQVPNNKLSQIFFEKLPAVDLCELCTASQHLTPTHNVTVYFSPCLTVVMATSHEVKHSFLYFLHTHTSKKKCKGC